MNILFVNVVNDFRRRKEEKTFPFLGTAYLASYLREYGGYNDITIIQAGQTLRTKTLEKFNPDVVGLSSVTQNFMVAQTVAFKIKRVFNVPVFVGGHHITALPQNLTNDMDFAVLGEGEQTCLELIACLHSNLKRIPGLAFREDSKLIKTPPRDLIRPLDSIPFPARDLLDLSDQISMVTSRGCPYNCVFCSSAFFWKTPRFHSPSYVVSEMNHIKTMYNPRQINLSDDLFIADKQRLKKIVQLTRLHKLHREIEFHCTARANLVNAETAKLLKKMGVKVVSIGFESASEKQLKFLKGGTVTVEQNRKAIEVLKQRGLNVSGTFIIGGRDETEGEIQKTYDFIADSKLDGGDTFILVPFPGTPLFSEAKTRGLVSDFMDWSRFEIYFEDNPVNRVVMSKTLSRDELLRWILEFKRLWKRIRRNAKLKQAVKHPRRIIPYLSRRIKQC